jgi:dolichol kinase
VAGAASVAILPFVLGLEEIAALAIFFTAVLALTRARNVLGSIHGVDRTSVGPIVFPAGLLLAVVIAWQHPAAIAYAALVLAIADPIAAIAGKRFGGPGWRAVGARKTLAGSVAFAIVAFAVGISLGLAAREIQVFIAAAAAAAVVVAIAEAGIGYGLDNLLVPVVASTIGVAWLDL